VPAATGYGKSSDVGDIFGTWAISSQVSVISVFNGCSSDYCTEAEANRTKESDLHRNEVAAIEQLRVNL
jgi:hypothetical protein